MLLHPGTVSELPPLVRRLGWLSLCRESSQPARSVLAYEQNNYMMLVPSLRASSRRLGHCVLWATWWSTCARALVVWTMCSTP